MTRKMILTIVCLLTLTFAGIHTVKSHPSNANQFEHEFEWLNGNVKANPYGLK